MLYYEMPWCTTIWICLAMTHYDMLRYVLKWRIFYDAQPLNYDLKVILQMKWFLKVYECILSSVICKEIMEVVLHDLLP